MKNDPTAEEMRAYLKKHWKGLVDLKESECDIEAAIYWFSSNWHGGQFSNLYSALSTSPYSPGPCCSGPEPESVEADMYDSLESQFIDAETLADSRAYDELEDGEALAQCVEESE